MLDRVDPPRGEGVAVTHPLDREVNRCSVVAGTHEVGMERVDRPVGPSVDGLDGEPRGHDALGEDLAAEDPPVRHLLALTEEDGDVLIEQAREFQTVDVGAGGRRAVLRAQAHLDCANLLEVKGVQQVRDRGLVVSGFVGHEDSLGSGVMPPGAGIRPATGQPWWPLRSLDL